MFRTLIIIGKILGIIAGTGLTVVMALYLIFGRGGEAEEIVWGVSFDPYYAESLGLDWQRTYLDLLDELGVRNFRLVAFWDELEPEDERFDFERLDFQISEAEKRGARVVLAVGRRLPRWPECHIPDWARGLSEERQLEEVLELLPRIVDRYKDSPALEYWQAENEPYVGFFGECSGPSAPFARAGIRVIESRDPGRPILVTDSGEISTWWPASRLSDHLGISMYRKAYEGRYTHLYYSYQPFFPQWYYRVKANFYRSLGLLETVFVSELQAEPWGRRPLTEISLEEQYETLDPDQLRYNLDFARSAGFDRIYLWGAEWWFYARDELGVPEFLEIVSELWENGN